MELNITYNTNYELKRVVWTLEKLDWYAENGYKSILPQGITKDNTKSELLDAIKKEYVEEDYKKVGNSLKLEFNKIQTEFLIKLKTKFNDEIPEILDVKLTQYGTGGSYQPPKTIIINITNKNCLKVALHEIVHLLAESTVQKQKLSHQEKEKLVESILTEIYSIKNNL